MAVLTPNAGRPRLLSNRRAGLSLLAFLAALGALPAQVGAARVWNGTWRVAFRGAVAMAVTAGAGALFGAVA
jgi:hypothetical protein